jgi:hypothetical protein
VVFFLSSITELTESTEKVANGNQVIAVKYYFLVISFFCLFVTAKADLRDIPPRNIKKIKFLFEELIAWHDFAYAIFGSKPMSLADYNLKVPGGLPIHRRLRSWYRLKKRKAGLEAWYKYREEFDLKDFIFLDEEKDLLRCLALVIINQKNMLKLLHEHETVFREELGESFTPESFLEKLARREISLAEATKNSQKLMGIMLGYGVRNASVFQERYDLMKEIAKREKENLPPQENGLIAKLSTLEAQVGDFSELEKNALLSPLYFLADLSHPETSTLKRRYESDRQKIEEMMKKSDFMDKVLQRLHSANCG